MRQCPRCGRYMDNHMISIFGGAKLVYNCVCGYISEEQNSGMYWSDSTNLKNPENAYSNASQQTEYRTSGTHD